MPTDDSCNAVTQVSGVIELTPTQRKIWEAYLKADAALRDAREASLRKFDLSLSEYELLWVLYHHDEPYLRMAEVANRIHQSRSRTTHTTNRLEKLGYVARKAHEKDGRGVILSLTKAGLKLLKEVQPLHSAALTETFLSRLSPAEQEELLKLLHYFH